MCCCAASEPRSKHGPYYLSPSIPSPIGYRSSTLWVTILLSKRRYVPTLSYFWLQVNCLWVKGVSLFMSCTVLYHTVLIYLYVGCMRKRITLHKGDLPPEGSLPPEMGLPLEEGGLPLEGGVCL